MSKKTNNTAVEQKEVTARAIYKYETRGVTSYGPYNIFSVDLVDWSNQPSGKYKYVMIIVDVATRYVWAYEMVGKDEQTVYDVLDNLFSNGHVCKYIWIDQEAAFKSKKVSELLKKYLVRTYHTYGQVHSSIAERFIRTLKENLNNRGFFHHKSGTWSRQDGVTKSVDEYNNTRHSATKYTPKEALFGTSGLRALVNTQILYDKQRKEAPDTQQLKVGDRVRVALKRDKFRKQTQNERWSRDLYQVVHIIRTNPTTYQVKHIDSNEIIHNTYYAQELRKSQL